MAGHVKKIKGWIVEVRFKITGSKRKVEAPGKVLRCKQ